MNRFRRSSEAFFENVRISDPPGYGGLSRNTTTPC